MATRYRLVEILPVDGKRFGKRVRTTIFSTTEREELKGQIKHYYQQPRKPWAETACYYGSKRVYEYEL